MCSMVIERRLYAQPHVSFIRPRKPSVRVTASTIDTPKKKTLGLFEEVRGGLYNPESLLERTDILSLFEYRESLSPVLFEKTFAPTLVVNDSCGN